MISKPLIRLHTRWFASPSFALFLLIGVLPVVQTAAGQQVGRTQRITAEGVPYRVFAEQGEATIRVYMLGGQGASGIYEIGQGTRFDELLALSALAPQPVQPRTKQRITIRHYHQEGGNRVLVFEEQLQEILQMNPNQYPELRDGDLIRVEVQTRNRFGWRDGLQILTSLSTVILLVERLTRVL